MSRRRSRQTTRAAARQRERATKQGAERVRVERPAPARSRLAQFAPFVLFGLMLFSRCGLRATQATAPPSDVQHVSMEMSESEFDPGVVTVRANHPVDVAVRNVGSTAHDWAVEGLGQPIHVVVDPGQAGNARFTPVRPGTYRIVASEPGHEEADAIGQLVVQ